MPNVTVRNLPEPVHRALRIRAATHGRSTEAEIRAILQEAVLPQERLHLGSALTEIGRKYQVTEAEVNAIESASEVSDPRSFGF